MKTLSEKGSVFLCKIGKYFLPLPCSKKTSIHRHLEEPEKSPVSFTKKFSIFCSKAQYLFINWSVSFFRNI